MENCIFCNIVSKEIPAHIVYEDDSYVGFLDIHPQSPGHVQVIPKKHYRWVWDLPVGRQVSPNAGEYFEVVQKIARAQQKAFACEAVWSRIMGDEVHHAHIWVFPNPHEATGEKDNFVENARKIKAAL